ncbi:MAG TPA: tetratricopeptide repeat protein [Noviherbaspirillum sp.]|nr:tetratricopeptide repeat protein [Noviherbaspirillum sp.]
MNGSVLRNDEGNALKQQGRLDEAEACYRQTLALKPDFAEAHYNLAWTLHVRGRLDEAKISYLKALEHDQQIAEAWNNLGLILSSQGQQDDAIECYQNAIALSSSFAGAYANLGIELRHQGRLTEAAASFRNAIELQPDFAEAHSNLGLTFADNGDWDMAAECYRKAISLKPDFVEAQANLADILDRQGKLDEAALCYQRVLVLRPDDAATHVTLGNAYRALHKLNDAAACYLKAIELQPKWAESYTNLGAIFSDQGNPDAAIEACQAALAIKPEMAEAHNNIGLSLAAKGNTEEAIKRYRAALALKPEFAEAHNNLGIALAEKSDLHEAVKCYQSALALKPDFVDALNNLGVAFQRLGKPDDAIACHWKALALKPDHTDVYHCLLMGMLYSARHTPAEIFAAHRQFGERFEAPLKPFWPKHDNPRDKNKRLKIGYVSGDFYSHSVAFFFGPVLAYHDKSQVEVFCYYNNHIQDEITHWLAAKSDHWIPSKGLSDDMLAERIKQDGIDILVDLSGHTAHNRLLTFARKPAPIQITWIGAPTTTGLSAMDYRLTDAAMDPPGMTEAFHTETLLRLPASCQFQPAANRPPVNELPALTQGAFTFACLNNLAKITDEAIELWAQILCALPQARLMLGNVNDARTRESLTDKFAQFGIAEARLVMHPKMLLDAFLALHLQIDLALDPFPYTGGTTSFHALSMGVPVLTLAGTSPMSRCGAAVMTYAGLPEFITYSKEEYAQRAIEFAGDLRRLDEMRQSLHARFTVSAQAAQAENVRHLEQLYRQVWEKWCDGAADFHSSPSIEIQPGVTGMPT